MTNISGITRVDVIAVYTIPRRDRSIDLHSRFRNSGRVKDRETTERREISIPDREDASIRHLILGYGHDEERDREREISLQPWNRMSRYER